MRVVVAHNRYRSNVPSGENSVVDAEIEQLRSLGHDVQPLLYSSDDLTSDPSLAASAAIGWFASPVAIRRLREICRERTPDVLHIHNPFPLVSPWIVREAHAEGIPVVQTVHNYRHICIAGIMYRAGAPCRDCIVARTPVPGVIHACYRGSRIQSAAMALGQVAHRGTWRSVERFFALTPYMAAQLAYAGIRPSQIVLRPTSAPDPGDPTPPGRDLVFVGRLDRAKGIDTLIAAWRIASPDRRLIIVGSGPLEGIVKEAAASDERIIPRGLLPPAEVAAAILQAGVLVVPSNWYEGLPRVVIEGLSHGRPVAVSDIGSLASAVTCDSGWLVSPTVPDWAEWLWGLDDDADLMSRGRAARAEYLRRYTPERSLEVLLATYQEVVEASHQRIKRG